MPNIEYWSFCLLRAEYNKMTGFNQTVSDVESAVGAYNISDGTFHIIKFVVHTIGLPTTGAPYISDGLFSSVDKTKSLNISLSTNGRS
jgi:hypothetical protein